MPQTTHTRKPNYTYIYICQGKYVFLVSLYFVYLYASLGMHFPCKQVKLIHISRLLYIFTVTYVVYIHIRTPFSKFHFPTDLTYFVVHAEGLFLCLQFPYISIFSMSFISFFFCQTQHLLYSITQVVICLDVLLHFIVVGSL